MKKPFLTETKILVLAVIMILPIYHQVRLDWIMSGGGGLAGYVLALLIGCFVYTMCAAHGTYFSEQDLEYIRDPLVVFLVFPFFGAFIVMLSVGVYIFFDEILPVLIEKIF